jgi:TatD DNase family protein
MIDREGYLTGGGRLLPTWNVEKAMLVDAHCHLLGSYPEKENLYLMLKRAQSAGVRGFIAVGTDLEDCGEVLALAKGNANIQACLGVHPHEAKTWGPDTEAHLAALLADPNARFVGETGLDWHYDLSPRDVQETVFRAQIRLARRLGKPLMIHTREAAGDTLRILREEGAEQVGGVIHCFSEDKAFAVQVLDLGFYLSFSGIVTFKKAEAIQEVAAWAPEDRILLETDSPYLAPMPHRGKTNEPAYVTFVAERVATLRHITATRVADLTTGNLEALCGWAPSS